MEKNRKYVVVNGHRYVVHEGDDCEYIVVRGAKYKLVEVPEGVCIEDGSSCPYPHGSDCRECSRYLKKSRKEIGSLCGWDPTAWRASYPSINHTLKSANEDSGHNKKDVELDHDR